MDKEKKTISDLIDDENKGPTFEEESNEYAGDDVIVKNKIYFSLFSMWHTRAKTRLLFKKILKVDKISNL